MPPLDEIVRRLVAECQPRRVVLFGCRARGDDEPDSDLDLFVEMETRLRPIDRIRKIDALFAGRRWPMDVVVLTPAEVNVQRGQHNSLLRAIEAEGRVLYKQP